MRATKLLVAGVAGVMVAVGLVACAGAVSERAVRQAVFRQQVSYWLAGHARESGVVVCLGVRDGNTVRGVEAAVLNNVGERSSTRSAQECQTLPGGAVERSTSRPAIVVTVGGVVWRGRGEALVEVEHFRSATVSGRRKYRVVRQGDVWTCLGQVVDMTPA